MDAITHPPIPVNEPPHSYAPDSAQRRSLASKIASLAAGGTDLTMTVGGVQRMAGGPRVDVVQPHRYRAVLGVTAQATDTDIAAAIDAALASAPAWRELPFDERAAIFLRAADEGHRERSWFGG